MSENSSDNQWTPSAAAQSGSQSDQLRELWVQHLRAAFSSMYGQPVEIAGPPAAYPAPKDFWFRQPFSLLTGALWCGFARAELIAIGKRLLSAAGLEEESNDTAIETVGEIIGQAAGALATEYSSRLGKDVHTARLEPGLDRPPAFPSEFPLEISCGGTRYGLLSGVEGGDLLTIFAPPALKEANPNAEASKAIAAAASASGGPAALSPVNARNLDLLLDVELPISVSFGRAQLQLKDVIKLTTGSIIELNRALSEPVDIIVNNCVIARGEVVVVEGNFGVRIQQIISKQDRLRSVT
jgi:flagellar motor switch protein FliN/FliY